jgi:hypothetical protein
VSLRDKLRLKFLVAALFTPVTQGIGAGMVKKQMLTVEIAAFQSRSRHT